MLKFFCADYLRPTYMLRQGRTTLCSSKQLPGNFPNVLPLPPQPPLLFMFHLTEEHLAVQQAARDFAQNELKPGVIERDSKAKYPTEQVKMMGELGFLGMMVSPEYGGGGMDTLSYVLAMEEISKVDSSCSVIMSVNNSLVCWGIEKFGSEAQKQKYLPKLVTGEWIGSFCLSEPEAGSDATSQRTTAIDMGDHYLLNGTKNWITNGATSKLHLVIAQTDVEKGHRGINCLIVEAGWKGVAIGAKEDKLGIRASDTTSIMYSDVKVPKENRVGEDGFGFKFAMKTLSGGRIGIAAQALGIAAGAYELSVAYAKERQAFGKPIAQHQAIAFKLADMATDIEAARLLVYRAAYLKDKHQNFDQAAAMAKLFASEVAMKHTVEAVQIHGGYGFVKEYHVERLMRDAKITQIYEGTSEIQRMVVSRNVLNGELYVPML
jgi:alkylation response protein AidB-like acyl-CoA dehydrogenase